MTVQSRGEPAAPSAASHVRALDGFRGLAILSVLAFHTVFLGLDFPLLPSGYQGVTIFFVLSGYLITSILLKEAQRTGTIQITRFYYRRALRLLPALVFMVLIVILYTALTDDGRQLTKMGESGVAILLYVYNWHLYFLDGSATMFSHLWSLSIEEQFYVLWPLIILVLYKRGLSLRNLLVITIAAIIAPEVLRVLFWPESPDTVPDWRTDLRVDAIACGAAVAIVLQGLTRPLSRNETWLLQAAGILAAVVLLYQLQLPFTPDRYLYRVRVAFSACSIASAIVIASLVCGPPRVVELLWSLRPLAWLGRVSYGVYLWHLPIYLVVAEHLDASPWQKTLLAVTLSVAAGAASHYLLEQPILRFRDRQVTPRQPVLSEERVF